MTTELLAIADELYALPLADFTAARDDRTRELKGTPQASQVKGLRKPTTAAWVVNLLIRREPDQIDQLLSVGAALRAAQEAMSAGELRNLTRQRRQVTAALTTRARQLAADEGLRVSEGVAAQVEASLTAAMVDAECGRALRSGLLVTTLSTTGLEPMPPESLAAALALPAALGFAASPTTAPTRPQLHVVPDPDKAAKLRSAAQERLAAAKWEYDEAAANHEAAVDELARLEARSLQLQAEIDEHRRRLAELEDDSDGLDEELAQAQEARDDASAELRTASAQRDSAQAAADRLAAD